MSKAFNERLETYRKLKEANPDEKLAFFAAHFGVNIGTVSRWNKKLKKLSIQEEAIDELRAQIEKEMEAKYQGRFEDQEREREEAAAKKAEAERRKRENKREYFKHILQTCQKVDVYPNSTVDVTWQGHRFTLIGGQKNTVPEVIAGVWQESQKAQAQANLTIARFATGQYLGKV